MAQPAIGQAAKNTLFQIQTGSPPAYVTIANVGDITGPQISANVVDVTAHRSQPSVQTAVWKERITTLRDLGDSSFPLHYIPSSGASTGATVDQGHNFTTGLGLLLVTITNVPTNCKVVFPDSAVTTHQFTAFLSKYAIKATVAGDLMADIVFSGTGTPTLA